MQIRIALFFVWIPFCFSFLHTTPIRFVSPNPFSKTTKTITMAREQNAALFQMIRPANIFPTFLLSFIGGWIVQPNPRLLLANRFWISTLITQLVMYGSMVINDIYDIDVDRTNNPSRPLPSGEVSVRSAFIFTSGLFSAAILLGNMFFADTKLPVIIISSICALILYTPVFKHFCFVKNLVCASIVSGSIGFSGFAVGLHNPYLLYSIIRLVAASSIHMEILNDIRDYDGDKMSNIETIPVVFGKPVAGFISKIILYLGILDAIVSSLYYPFHITIGIAIACYPMIKYIKTCEEQSFSKHSIRRATNGTTISLFLNMLIFCYAATIRL